MLSNAEFLHQWEVQKARITMGDPEFFGVTKEQAKRYKKLLAEEESNLYHPGEDEGNDTGEDNVVAECDFVVIDPMKLPDSLKEV